MWFSANTRTHYLLINCNWRLEMICITGQNHHTCTHIGMHSCRRTLLDGMLFVLRTGHAHCLIWVHEIVIGVVGDSIKILQQRHSDPYKSVKFRKTFLSWIYEFMNYFISIYSLAMHLIKSLCSHEQAYAYARVRFGTKKGLNIYIFHFLLFFGFWKCWRLWLKCAVEKSTSITLNRYRLHSHTNFWFNFFSKKRWIKNHANTKPMGGLIIKLWFNIRIIIIIIVIFHEPDSLVHLNCFFFSFEKKTQN